MLKIIITFLIIVSTFITLKAEDNLRIYSREEWWANEEYRYWDSTYWKEIFIKRNKANEVWNTKWSNFSQEKKYEIINKNNKKSEKKIKMNNYLSSNFEKYIKIASYNKYDWTNKLAWPISKTNYVKNIVIHHTHSEYSDSFKWIKDIYKYHAINREWWDIWYNYIIWYNWEIFEWRAWWDYVVWAHDTWNNYSTVWVSIMWNYDKKDLSEIQYTALKKLVSHLTKKYWIDLNKKIPYHKECFWENCKNWLETTYYYPIVGHKDWKWTHCPGENIYHKVIPRLITELQEETRWYELISYKNNKIERHNYKNKINKYNWKSIRKKFDNLSDWKQKIIIYKLQLLLNKKDLDWKQEILYNKFLDELRI